jgi:uncharacterized protein (DUF433 family)
MQKVDQPTVTATEHCYIVKNDRILSGEPIIKGDEIENQLRYI